jgi:hypothetical protein
MLSAFVKANPNATAALAGGSGIGTLAVYALSLFGVNLDPVLATAVGGLVASLILLIGRNGIRGVIRLVWRGKSA